MEKSYELNRSDLSKVKEKRGDFLRTSHLPFWVQRYIHLAIRNYRINNYGKLSPSSFYENYEGWGAESQKEALEKFLNKVQSFSQEGKRNFLETLGSSVKVSKGGLIELVKKGRSNCLDWSIAVALNYNTQTRFSPHLENTEAVIIFYSLLDGSKHFGVVIIDQNKKRTIGLYSLWSFLFNSRRIIIYN